MTGGQGQTTTVLVQDHSRLYRESLALLLDQQPGFESVGTAETTKDLLASLASVPCHSVIVETSGDVSSARSALSAIHETAPSTRILMTVPEEAGTSSVDERVRLIRRTASTSEFVAALSPGPLPSSRRQEMARSASTPAKMTRRELHVLALLAEGMTTSEMAERLQISAKTVENHRLSLFAKLGVQNQSAAVAVALRTGLLVGPNKLLSDS